MDSLTINQVIKMLRRRTTHQWAGMVKIGEKVTDINMTVSMQLAPTEEGKEPLPVFMFNIGYGNMNHLGVNFAFLTALHGTDVEVIEEIIKTLASYGHGAIVKTTGMVMKMLKKKRMAEKE